MVRVCLQVTAVLSIAAMMGCATRLIRRRRRCRDTRLSLQDRTARQRQRKRLAQPGDFDQCSGTTRRQNNSALIEDLPRSEDPTTLARDIEKALSNTSAIQCHGHVTGFSGPYPEQIRVLGEATSRRRSPTARGHVLDLMIAVGGLTDFADGNNATIMRTSGGQAIPFASRTWSRGDIAANVDVKPGDILHPAELVLMTLRRPVWYVVLR
jgi:hypothetical protein